jgi:hypothetical protein
VNAAFAVVLMMTALNASRHKVIHVHGSNPICAAGAVMNNYVQEVLKRTIKMNLRLMAV